VNALDNNPVNNKKSLDESDIAHLKDSNSNSGSSANSPRDDIKVSGTGSNSNSGLCKDSSPNSSTVKRKRK